MAGKKEERRGEKNKAKRKRSANILSDFSKKKETEGEKETAREISPHTRQMK